MKIFRSFPIASLIFLLVFSAVAVAQDTEPQILTGKGLELKACGQKNKEVKYSNESDENDHTLGTPTADAALVYVVRTLRMPLGQYKFAMDGEWKGMNRTYAYFFFTAPPGEHYFCSKGGQKRTLILTLEAGKTYYLEQNIKYLGPWVGYSEDLFLLDPEQGSKYVKETFRSSFKEK